MLVVTMLWRRVKTIVATYLAMPEMKIFWLFFSLSIVILVIDFLNLPLFFAFFNFVVLCGVASAIFLNSFRAANANLVAKVRRAELESIVRDLRDGVIAYDENFTILVFNRAAEEIFSLRAEEVLGKSFSLRLKDDPRATKYRLLLTVLFPALAPVVVRRSEVSDPVQLADIALIDPEAQFRVATSRLLNDGGAAVGYVKVVRDRTREVEILRSKTEFIAVASHELRAPLTSLSWAFETLKGQSLPPETSEIVQSAYRATQHLLKIVDDLLDVAKIEEGKFGYQFQELHLVAFVENALQQAELLARQYRVKVYFDPAAGGDVKVMADPKKLGTALANLIDNAIKYNTQGGELIAKIERMPHKPFAKVSLHDTGIGIPPEAMDRLFTKFFRAENAKRAVTEGTGLGLYITKNIIRRHGGEIWAESVLNRGSTFSFTLPLDFSLIPTKEIAYEEEM